MSFPWATTAATCCASILPRAEAIRRRLTATAQVLLDAHLESREAGR